MSELHDFDLLLTDYLHHNIHRHLGNATFSRRIGRLDKRLADYFGTVFKTLPAPPAALPFLLNDKELDDLVWAIAELPLGRRRVWSASPRLHRVYSLCTGEINKRLSPTEADRWAADSADFTSRLEADGVSLSEGIAVVCEWLEELRFYLEAMGDNELLPRPFGQFPTPTTSAPTPQAPAGSVLSSALAESPEPETRMVSAVSAIESEPNTDPSVGVPFAPPPAPKAPQPSSSSAGPTATGRKEPASLPSTNALSRASQPGANASEAEAALATYMQIMRGAIAKHPKGIKAMPEELIEQEGVNEQMVRRALRQLSEYEGFARKQSAKYRTRDQS